ncbi:MAG: hypothetical protein LBT68_04415, partial [Spirochaetales bacterium]|nr:hypothetical protein [Spirochaetales bacterium]
MQKPYAALLCAGLFLIASCATTTGTRFPAIDDAVAEGRFEEALSTVRTSREEDELSIYNAKNEIGFLLDRGLLAHYAGDYGASSKDLEESELLIEEAFTQSISDNFKSTMLKNSYEADYTGEDFENIYVNIFNALNYYHAGDIDNAIVEIKSLNDKLLYIRDQYEAQKEEFLEQAGDFLFGEETYYTKSALARYLGLLFYRGIGKPDDARIDAQEIGAAFEASPSIYTNTLPPELVMRGETCDELEIPKGMARLNALCFTGLSPYKIAVNTNIIWRRAALGDPNSTLNKAGWKAQTPIKALAFRMSPVDRIEIEIDGGKKFSPSLLESIVKVMQEVYETREARRQGSMALYNFTTELGAVLTSDLAWEIGSIFGSDPAAAVQEKIEEENTAHDLRMTRCLPGGVYVGGINLAPGSYSLSVNYYSGKTLAHSRRYEKVSVQAEKLNIIEDYCFKYTESALPDVLTEKTVLPDFPGRLPAPEGIKIKASTGNGKSSQNSYTVSWDAVPGATRYALYWRVPTLDTYLLDS